MIASKLRMIQDTLVLLGVAGGDALKPWGPHVAGPTKIR
jgi:hypothetical protein